MSDTSFLKDNLKGAVPVEIAEEVVKNIVTDSVAFRVCNHTSMISDKKTMPMLKDTGRAYWVGEGEKIGTSIHDWEYPELEAKKLAVIVPFTKEKLDDTVISVMEEIKQGIADAFTRAIDSAIFFGTESPFTNNIVSVGANAVINKTNKLDIDISDAMSKVEKTDLSVSAIIAPNTIKGELRKLRDTNNNALVVPGEVTGQQIYNTNIYIPTSKVWDSKKANLIIGDFTKAIIGTRQDIEYTVLDQATVGDINLAEEDMIAIKATMRLGFEIIDTKAFSLIKQS